MGIMACLSLFSSLGVPSTLPMIFFVPLLAVTSVTSSWLSHTNGNAALLGPFCVFCHLEVPANRLDDEFSVFSHKGGQEEKSWSPCKPMSKGYFSDTLLFIFICGVKTCHNIYHLTIAQFSGIDYISITTLGLFQLPTLQLCPH